MKKLSKHDLNVLRKFIEWTVVSSEKDDAVLIKYAGLGFVKSGFDWDNMKKTAKLTKLGIEHL